MTSIEFGKICQSLNIGYRSLFGYIPNRGDYKCTQEEYFDALQRAVEGGIEVSNILSKRKKNNNNDRREEQ